MLLFYNTIKVSYSSFFSHFLQESKRWQHNIKYTTRIYKPINLSELSFKCFSEKIITIYLSKYQQHLVFRPDPILPRIYDCIVFLSLTDNLDNHQLLFHHQLSSVVPISFILRNSNDYLGQQHFYKSNFPKKISRRRMHQILPLKLR